MWLNPEGSVPAPKVETMDPHSVADLPALGAFSVRRPARRRDVGSFCRSSSSSCAIVVVSRFPVLPRPAVAARPRGDSRKLISRHYYVVTGCFARKVWRTDTLVTDDGRLKHILHRLSMKWDATRRDVLATGRRCGKGLNCRRREPVDFGRLRHRSSRVPDFGDDVTNSVVRASTVRATRKNRIRFN